MFIKPWINGFDPFSRLICGLLEKGPVLSVKVGSYHYDPLSELHYTKFVGA